MRISDWSSDVCSSDLNQNAKDRTVASAYSIRPLADARVSTPLEWDEVRARRPEEFTVATVLERFAAIGDPHRGIDETARSEEHTSELQSLMRISYAVFCLKKQNMTTTHSKSTTII